MMLRSSIRASGVFLKREVQSLEFGLTGRIDMHGSWFIGLRA